MVKLSLSCTLETKDSIQQSQVPRFENQELTRDKLKKDKGKYFILN